MYYAKNGNYNVALGVESMGYKKSGSKNTALGSYAGSKNSSGSGNVFIGYQAGFSEKGSNKLYIANSKTKTPLIKGNFGTKRLDVYGVLYANALNKRSDARLKADIKDIDRPLETVLKLEGKHYRLKETNTEDMGLLAQDLEKVLPELVSESDDGYKAISYESLTALLIEAVKAQNEEITSLREENTSLKTHMSDQQKAIDTLMTRMANLESTSLVQN